MILNLRWERYAAQKQKGGGSDGRADWRDRGGIVRRCGTVHDAHGNDWDLCAGFYGGEVFHPLAQARHGDPPHAQGIALALEFKLGGEVLRTVVVREWAELGILGAIIALRGLLTFLIHWEIKNEEQALEKGRAAETEQP